MVADAIAKVRLPQACKTRYQGAARRSGKTLSAFVRQACDQATTGLDTAAGRADLATLRRYVNGFATVANEAAQGGLDRATVHRLGRDAAAMRAILDKHLAGVRT
jgi:hypothetical protein